MWSILTWVMPQTAGCTTLVLSQAPADAHFDHSPIDLGLGKAEKGDDGDAAKNGQIGDRFKVGQGALDQLGACLLADQLTVHADAFAKAMQMGTGEKPGAVTQMT